MRIEILLIAALAFVVNAAPQWPYRDAVAPYYYGYPGKTPYMYRAEEDDEMEETSNLARQDLKVATSDGGSTVVVEDDEKADGVRVVETGSAKPVAQSSNNNNQNQVQQDSQQLQQQPAAQSSAQQPLNNNGQTASNSNANNGQPLTVQQPGQQPPQAFPPARPNQNARPQQRPAEEEDEEDDDEDSEEDDEDAEDDEDDGDDDDEDEDEEDDEDRKRNIISNKQQQQQASVDSGSGSEEPAAGPEIQPVQAIVPVPVNSDVSDEIPEEPVQPASQQAVVINKVIKNKQANAGAAAVAAAVGAVEKPKKKNVVNAKTKNPQSGAIEALVPGYVTDQGEVLVPVDTVTGNQPITIVPDPFSPPSRIVAGPRPIPQRALPSTPSRQVPFWYRSNPAIAPPSPAYTPEIAPTPLGRQTLYSAVPPPGSIFTFDDDDDDDDTPSIIPGQRLRQAAADDDDDDEDEDEEADQKATPKPQKVPLAAVPAVGNSNEDDEAEALAFVNSGKPSSGNRRPQSASGGSGSGTASGGSGSGNKKPAAGTTKPGTSDESESVEDQESDEQDEEEEEDEEEEDEEDDSAAARRGGNKARMYVDEDYVSFPPSRSPTLFAVIQGRIPYSQGNIRPQSQQVFSTPNPNNPFQRYVVRVTPSNRAPRPPVPSNSPLYYRPLGSSSPYSGGSTPNRRVVPVASFDVSVEDTRPSPSGISAGPQSIIVDSEEDGDSYSPGRPTPVTSYPFVYKVQGSLTGFRPSGGPGGPRPGSYGAIRPPRPLSFGPGPGGPGPYGPYGPPPPYGAILNALYGSGSPFGSGPGPRPSSHSHGRPPRPSGISDGPPVIIRKKPSGGSNRPPKPHLIAVYNPTGPSGPGPREPVDEEYYTYEVPEPENKLVPGQIRPPSSNKNKRPTVHRKPTPVIKQKQVVSEEEENSDESSISQGPPGPPMPMKIIPHGTVRRRIRGGKQLKPKKNSKKTTTPKKQSSQSSQLDQQDPLGLLSKINKSNKSKLH